MKTIIFPSDYFNINKIDEMYKKEYNVISRNGYFDIVLFSYDDFLENREIILNRIPNNSVSAIYRGWMMKSEIYADFYAKLQQKNITLLTSPENYRKFHEFPYIYPEIISDTAQMLIYPTSDSVDWQEVKQKFSKFMIKDYVKSVKETDFPKYISSDTDSDELKRLLEKFLQYRGTLYTGGICIKEYLNLKYYDNRTNEYRVFYIDGEIATVSRNSGQGNYTPLPPKELLMKYRYLSSPFYTVDYAQLTDNSWKIIETGDGQVSGLSDNQDIENFYRTLQILTCE